MKSLTSYIKSYTEEMEVWGIPLMEKSDGTGKQRHTLTASGWNKSFVDGSSNIWTPVGPPEVVSADVAPPPNATILNSKNKSKVFLMNLTLQTDSGNRLVVSKYLSSDEGGISNTEFKIKVGLKRTRESFKISTKQLLAGASTVDMDIGRVGAAQVEKFYAFSDANVLIDLVVKNLETHLQSNTNLVSAVESFLSRGCDHMNWPSDTPESLKVAITQVLSELIVGVCLLKNTAFVLSSKIPFTSSVESFYLPVKDFLSTIDVVLKLRDGNIVKFSSKVKEGAAAAFGPRLIWAAVTSAPNSPVHRAANRLLKGTEIGKFTDILRSRENKLKHAAYEYAFSLIGMGNVDAWVKNTASAKCNITGISQKEREELIQKVSSYAATKNLMSKSYFQALRDGDVCALSIVVRYIIADALNSDKKSQKPMLMILRMYEYFQLHMDKTAFMRTGSVKFFLKGLRSHISKITIDPGKGSLGDTSGSYGFLNFRLE